MIIGVVTVIVLVLIVGVYVGLQVGRKQNVSDLKITTSKTEEQTKVVPTFSPASSPAYVSASPVLNNTISKDGMQYFTAVNGKYQLSLPKNWVGYSPYDESFTQINKLEDGVISYGPTDKSAIVSVESLSSDFVEKSSMEKTLYDVVKNIRVDTKNYPLVSEYKMNGVTVYEHQAIPGLQAEMQYYYIFDKQDLIVMLGFSKNDAQTKEIVSSIRFLN